MFGMGVSVGDYDNDGWPDFFVTGVGGNRLFRNTDDGKGGRRFVETTADAGVGGPGGWPTATNEKEFLAWNKPVNFSTSATFLDYDGDGRLDLFVCNYITWSPDFDVKQEFALVGHGRAYGPPRPFEGTQCFLYRNLDGKRFKDVSAGGFRSQSRGCWRCRPRSQRWQVARRHRVRRGRRLAGHRRRQRYGAEPVPQSARRHLQEIGWRAWTREHATRDGIGQRYRPGSLLARYR